jgi:hypothetical protein
MLLTLPAMAQTQSQAQQSSREQKKNLVVKEWNTNAKGARTLDHVTTYNADGRKIEEIEYDSYGKQRWRKRFEWSGNDRKARELVYDERNRLVNFKKFDYNELGKKKAQYTYDAKGRLLTTKIYEYSTQDE